MLSNPSLTLGTIGQTLSEQEQSLISGGIQTKFTRTKPHCNDSLRESKSSATFSEEDDSFDPMLYAIDLL